MDNKVKLYLIDCCIAMIITGILLEAVDNDNEVAKWNFIFFSLLYLVVLKILHSLWAVYRRISDASTKTATKHNLELNVGTLTFIILSIIFTTLAIIKHRYLKNCIERLNTLSATICASISWLVFVVFDLNEQNDGDSFDINLMQGLDYGSGMAYSYYYGYLKFVLPSTGSLDKGLIENIVNTEDIHGITIAVHKLFVLIPFSAYIPTDIRESSYQWMESAMNLEADVRNRAGVQRRRYHNSVYKIYPGGSRANAPVYVVVEGATPLLTFFEVQKHAHPETDVYRKHCNAVVRKFYEKLQELIRDDPACADLCELIYYDDYDSDGAKVNVAKVILERVHRIGNVETTNSSTRNVETRREACTK